jgi:hypothetical protein
MTELTLLTKIYSSTQRREIDETIKNLFEGLDAQAAVDHSLNDRWVHVTLSGEDESVATNLLARDFGFCPETLQSVEKASVLKGFVTNIEKSKELTVDIGVSKPKATNASIPLSNLQMQLAGGKKSSLQKIAETWGISEYLPLTIKIINVNAEENKIEAELANEQIEKLMLWRDSLLDRLLVLGASRNQLDMAVEQAELDRDVINIEALGMFEHALVCKLGTDAAGLISRIGRRLRKAKFTVFNPKRIIAFLEAPQTPILKTAT